MRSRLSPLTIGLIVAGISIAVILTILIVVCVFIKCRKKKNKQNRTLDSECQSERQSLLPRVTTNDPLAEHLWYHGRISNEEAGRRLDNGANGIDGAYLVYINPIQPNEYILLVHYQRNSYRWKICRTVHGDRVMYVLGGDNGGPSHRYSTVTRLIRAHRGVRGKPIRVDKDHVVTLSMSYVIRSNETKSYQSNCLTKEEEKKMDGGNTESGGDLVSKRWYHGEISNEMAGDRLMKGGGKATKSRVKGCTGNTDEVVDGAYLVYDNPEQYILLIYYQGKSYRLKIIKSSSDGMYVLGEDKPEVPRCYTIEELIEVHRGKSIKIDENHVVAFSKAVSCHLQPARTVDKAKHEPMKYSYLNGSDNLISKPWYHGEISNETAEDRLKGNGNTDEKQLSISAGGTVDGAFLVYDNPEQYILMVSYQGEPLRWMIIKSSSDDMYVLGQDRQGVPRYRTVRELIKAHRGVTGTPIRVDKDHVVTLSKSYIVRPVRQ